MNIQFCLQKHQKKGNNRKVVYYHCLKTKILKNTLTVLLTKECFCISLKDKTHFTDKTFFHLLRDVTTISISYFRNSYYIGIKT